MAPRPLGRAEGDGIPAYAPSETSEVSRSDSDDSISSSNSDSSSHINDSDQDLWLNLLDAQSETLSEADSDVESETGAMKSLHGKDDFKDFFYRYGVVHGLEIEADLQDRAKNGEKLLIEKFAAQEPGAHTWGLASAEYVDYFYRDDQRAVRKHRGDGPSDDGPRPLKVHMAKYPMVWRMEIWDTGMKLMIAPVMTSNFYKVVTPDPNCQGGSLTTPWRYPTYASLEPTTLEDFEGRRIEFTMLGYDMCKVAVELRHLRPDKPEFKHSTQKITFYGERHPGAFNEPGDGSGIEPYDYTDLNFPDN